MDSTKIIVRPEAVADYAAIADVRPGPIYSGTLANWYKASSPLTNLSPLGRGFWLIVYDGLWGNTK